MTVPVAVESPKHRLIHIADHHFVPKEAFAADLRSLNHEPLTADDIDEAYEEHLLEVEIVQTEQRAVLLCLIQHHGLERVYIEGLTEWNKPAFDVEILGISMVAKQIEETKADLPRFEPSDQQFADALGKALIVQQQRHRLDLLRIGAAAQLFMEGKLVEILAPEDAEAYAKANPITEDGTVNLDASLIEVREDAIVRKLAETGRVTVLVLGGGHELADNVRRLAGDVELIEVELQAWRQFGGE